MRRWLPMSPMSRRHAKTRNPMNPLAARRAVENEPTEFALKFGIRVQQFEAEHLRLERDGM